MQKFLKRIFAIQHQIIFSVCRRTWRGTTCGGEGGGGHNQPADAPLVQQVSSVVALNSNISSIPNSLCKDPVGRCPWTSSRWWSRTEEATRWSATAPASRTRLSQTWSSSENTSSKRNKAKNTFGNTLISWEICTKGHSYYHLGWNLSMPKENYRSTIRYTTNQGRLFSIRFTFLQIVDSPETLKAIGGCFGLAGIVTAITLK